jgi:hypothetical protein
MPSVLVSWCFAAIEKRADYERNSLSIRAVSCPWASQHDASVLRHSFNDVASAGSQPLQAISRHRATCHLRVGSAQFDFRLYFKFPDRLVHAGRLNPGFSILVRALVHSGPLFSDRPEAPEEARYSEPMRDRRKKRAR